MNNNTTQHNRGYCPSCNKIVPVKHVERDGKMYLSHECPECGTKEMLISSDASRWRYKHDLVGYDVEAKRTCSLDCMACNHGKPPTLVFLDVTNRCNMNCPICLANVKAMGFRFDPPMEYFDKVFKYLATFDSKPKIELFGGEPTVREDLIDIIELAKSYGLSARIVTNGIRFEDEEYCKKILATGTQLMYSFDGRSPEIYNKLRRNPGAYKKKARGLENVKKHYHAKLTLMCCVGLGVNEDYMADLIEYCNDNRDFIAALDMIPLNETWGPEEVDAHETTIEDVERIIADAVPGTEFVPASTLYMFKTFPEYFDLGRITFGGAHPNCESVSALVSDGTQYRPLNHYLKRPLTDVVHDAIEKDKELGKTIDHHPLVRLFGKKGARVVLGAALLNFVRKNVDFRAVFGENAGLQALKFAWGLIQGKKVKTLFRTLTHCHYMLRLIILPFEEPGCVESARLVECPASFAYEHPETGDIHLMPVCAWANYKDDILKATAEKYGVAQ